MNSRILAVGIISIVVFGTLLFSGKKEDERVVQGVQSQVSANDDRVVVTLDSQLKSMGAVEVEVTPVNVKPGQNMIFAVSLNTHSVELSYNYTMIISAQDDVGNKYKAITWSGGEGGHHLSGELVFEELAENSTQVQLTIDGIDNEKAVFEWDL